MLKKFLIIISLILMIMVSQKAKAATETVNVSAIVPSKVSFIFSYSELSANETLADPINHSVLLTVYLRDASDNPLSGLNVLVTSNRGSVDIIEAISKIGSGDPEMNKDQTDVQGRVMFRIGSWMAGDAQINILADNLITLPSQSIRFLPLPFPAQLTVTIPIPGIEKEIVVIEPAPSEGELTPKQQEAKKLANVGTKIVIPYWIPLIIIILLLIIPILLIINHFSLKKIRAFENSENHILNKIATHDDINILRQDIDNHINNRNRY